MRFGPAPTLPQNLPLHANTIIESSSAILFDGNRETNRCRIEFCCLVIGGHDFPIAADWLTNLDRDGPSLVIAQGNLVFQFVEIGSKPFVVHLLSLTDHVKRIAD